jgi:methylated-DNA-[protein]-cysteine S-methyltransferase
MLEWADVNVDGLKLRIVASSAGIRTIEFDAPGAIEDQPSVVHNPENRLLAETRAQLQAYFAGQLRAFQIPLDMQGTPFQLRVWRRLGTISYGETRSYRQIATAIGAPAAVRAVGAANGANPIPIIVPCHRVIGASGKLVGYGGGLPLKKRLLELEGALAMSLDIPQ